MVDNISSFNNGHAQASIASSNYKSDAAKTSGFESALNAASESKDNEKIMEAAREFESYFLQMMLKEMRNSVPRDGLIPKSNAEEIFQSALDEEYSKNAAKGKGIGLAQMIYDQMTKKNQLTPYVAQASIQGTAGNGGTAADNTTVGDESLQIKE